MYFDFGKQHAPHGIGISSEFQDLRPRLPPEDTTQQAAGLCSALFGYYQKVMLISSLISFMRCSLRPLKAGRTLLPWDTALASVNRTLYYYKLGRFNYISVQYSLMSGLLCDELHNSVQYSLMPGPLCGY